MARERWWHRTRPDGTAAPGVARRSPGEPAGRLPRRSTRLAPTARAGSAALVIAAVGALVVGETIATGSASGADRAIVDRAPAAARGGAPVVGEPLIRAPWLARRPDGTWLVGRPGHTVALERDEIGLAVRDGWLLTSTDASYGRSIAWRRVDGSDRGNASIAVVPASVAVAGSVAYVTGFDRDSGGDPGLFAVGLHDATVSRVLDRSTGRHPRSALASPDGARVVSATCDDSGRCDLATFATAPAGVVQTVVAPGYLRSTTGSVAIVGPDPASWIAGVDLATGRELWRRAAVEMWSGYTTSDGRLIQAELRDTASGPTFAVEAIDARTGSATSLLTSAVGHGIGLWPELSSDDRFAVGPAYSLDDALAKAHGTPVSVRVLAVADGRELGSEAIDGSVAR